MSADKGWKCTIDENYDASAPIERPKESIPDSEISDWQKIGALPSEPARKLDEIEMLLGNFSYVPEVSLEEIRRIDGLALYLYMNACMREGFPQEYSNKPWRYSKDTQSYHFLALRVSTDMMSIRANEHAALLRLPADVLQQYIDEKADVLIGDDYMVCFSIESMDDFGNDIAMCVKESLLRINLIRELIE